MADLDKPYKITERVNGILEKTLNTVEPKFVKQVVEWVSKFQTSSGNLTRSKSNKDRIATFKTAIERHLQRAGYYDMISKFLVGFDEMSAAQTEIQQDLNAISLTKSFLNTFKRVAINQVITNMEKQGLLQSLINPLRNQLNIAVNQGSSLADTVQSIRGQLETTEKRQGILKKLSLQSTRDALGQYDGTVNEAVRKTYKLDAILYVGSLVKDSRAQCERWTQYMDNGKRGLILFEQLEQEIMWADANGTGMIPNTTPENFCQNRGGFNCRHVAYPVRNPNKITTAGNVSTKVDADISAKEQQAAIQKLKVPEVKLGFDKKYDDIINSDDVTDEAKILIDKLEKPKDIISSTTGSYYDSTTKTLAMRDYGDEKRFNNTFNHEYGHHIDFLNNYSLSKEFKQAYKDDLKTLKKDYGNFDELIPKLLKEWQDENGKYKYKIEYWGASDILDSLTIGRVFSDYYGVGHGKNYFKNKNNRHIENFANIFQAWSSTDKTSIKNIEKYYPNLYKAFLDIIKTL
jgi:hypothetical protein